MNGARTPRELVIVRRLAAPRELVWRAWTDPVLMARWLHPHDVTTAPGSVEVVLEVGGRYRFTMIDPSGQSHHSGGEYLELQPPHLLRSTWGAPGEPIAELEVRLASLTPQQTEMTFTLRGVADDSGRADSVWTGWREAIDELAQEMEGRTNG